MAERPEPAAAPVRLTPSAYAGPAILTWLVGSATRPRIGPVLGGVLHHPADFETGRAAAVAALVRRPGGGTYKLMSMLAAPDDRLPYLMRAPHDTGAAVRHVQQPKDSKVCGQACVAMLAGIKLATAVQTVATVQRPGRGRGTTGRHVRQALEGLGWTMDALERIPPGLNQSAVFVTLAALPDTAICRIRWAGTVRRTHWILMTAEAVHDPLDAAPLSHLAFSNRLRRRGATMISWARVRPAADRPGRSPRTPGTPRTERRKDTKR